MAADITFPINLPDTLTFTIENVEIGGSLPTYPGPYSVTPTRETQTLATNGKGMSADVIVNPIPSNYGLITYNGFITVS